MTDIVPEETTTDPAPGSWDPKTQPRIDVSGRRVVEARVREAMTGDRVTLASLTALVERCRDVNMPSDTFITVRGTAEHGSLRGEFTVREVVVRHEDWE